MVLVIGAGFGRTGTSSLREALEQLLGAPCYHMKAVMQGGPDHANFWLGAARDRRAGKPFEATAAQEVLAGYAAAVDWPSSAFYKELMCVYPDAKVVLSVREDTGKWWDSVWGSIFMPQRDPWMRLVRAVNPLCWGHGAMVREVVWDGTFGGRFGDKAHATKVHDEWVAEVKRHVPAGKLLVHTSRDGWAPLCAFLGVPVPDTPYPRVNDTASTVRLLTSKHRQRAAELLWGCPALAAAALGDGGAAGAVAAVVAEAPSPAGALLSLASAAAGGPAPPRDAQARAAAISHALSGDAPGAAEAAREQALAVSDAAVRQLAAAALSRLGPGGGVAQALASRVLPPLAEEERDLVLALAGDLGSSPGVVLELAAAGSAASYAPGVAVGLYDTFRRRLIGR